MGGTKACPERAYQQCWHLCHEQYVLAPVSQSEVATLSVALWISLHHKPVDPYLNNIFTLI